MPGVNVLPPPAMTTENFLSCMLLPPENAIPRWEILHLLCLSSFLLTGLILAQKSRELNSFAAFRHFARTAVQSTFYEIQFTEKVYLT